jgi:hypothetical protein
MFRLLKLMAFALFGYAVYEFFRGMSDTSGAGGGGRGGQRSMGGRPRSEAFGRAQNQGQLTGAGEGREEATLDTDGGSVRHRVGRGAARASR